MPLVVIIKKQYNINSSKMKKNLMTYAAGRLVLTVSFCCAMTNSCECSERDGRCVETG